MLMRTTIRNPLTRDYLGLSNKQYGTLVALGRFVPIDDDSITHKLIILHTKQVYWWRKKPRILGMTKASITAAFWDGNPVMAYFLHPTMAFSYGYVWSMEEGDQIQRPYGPKPWYLGA